MWLSLPPCCHIDAYATTAHIHCLLPSTCPNLCYPLSLLLWIHCPTIMVQPSMMTWLDAHIPQWGEGQEWGDWRCSWFTLGEWMGIQGDAVTSQVIDDMVSSMAHRWCGCMIVVEIAMVLYCVELLSLNWGWYALLESSVGSSGGRMRQSCSWISNHIIT